MGKKLIPGGSYIWTTTRGWVPIPSKVEILKYVSSSLPKYQRVYEKYGKIYDLRKARRFYGSGVFKWDAVFGWIPKHSKRQISPDLSKYRKMVLEYEKYAKSIPTKVKYPRKALSPGRVGGRRGGRGQMFKPRQIRTRIVESQLKGKKREAMTYLKKVKVKLGMK